MNKIKVMIFTIFLLCLSFITANASDDISLYINGKKTDTDVAPIAIEGRTFVPARSIFEKLGAEVTWIGSRQQIIIRSVKTRIVLNLGSDTAYVNNDSVQMDVAPMVVDQRTLIPVRFVSEELGYNVRWEPSDNSVHIDTNKTSTAVRTEINSIDVNEKSSSTSVTVKLNELKKPKISYASDPNRFIADFEGVSLKVSGSKKTVDNDDVKEVRYAVHPDYTRVVIESPDEVSYSVRYSGNSMVITISAVGEDGEELTEDDDVTINSDTKDDEEPSIIYTGEHLIVLDPGHGGADCGAIGYDEDGNEDVFESEINLEIALKVRDYLEDEGISVLMTRDDDVMLGESEMEDLLARSEIANDAGATFFVSIHNNSFTEPTATGTEVLYADCEDKVYSGVTSKELAENIQKPLAEATGLADRGVKDSPKIVVLRTTTMPSVLIETVFLSNPNDLEVVKDEDKIDEIGYAIAQGIVKSLGDLE